MIAFTIMTLIASAAIIGYAKAAHERSQAYVKIEQLERWLKHEESKS